MLAEMRSFHDNHTGTRSLCRAKRPSGDPSHVHARRNVTCGTDNGDEWPGAVVRHQDSGGGNKLGIDY